MTDLEVYRAPAELAVAHDIDSWTQVAGQVIKLANEIYDTPFVPDGLRGSVPATAAAILAGRERGLGPMTSLANVHVIKGKPALSAALMRALILAQGHQIETVDISDTRAVVRGRRRGEAAWEEASFTADQAKRAGIMLGGYPQDKLYARATSRLARRKFADVIAGMPYSAEELEDGTDSEPVTETATPAAQPAQRTARRARTAATQTTSPAAAQSPAAPPPTPPADAAGEAPPERCSSGQRSIVERHLNRLGIETPADQLDALKALTGREVGGVADLTPDEAQDAAWRMKPCDTREQLVALLATGEVPT